MDETNIRRDIFRTIYNLIDTNKATNWTVRAFMANADMDIPCIVVDPIKMSADRWNVSNEGAKRKIVSVDIHFLVSIDGGPAQIDHGRDNVYNTLGNTANLDTLYRTYNLALDTIEDSDYADIEINTQNFITAVINVRFKI